MREIKFGNLAIICLLGLCVPMISAQEDQCEDGWLPFQRLCYKAFTFSGDVGWLEAQGICQEAGGQLAEPYDLSTLEFILEVAAMDNAETSEHVTWYIGLSDKDDEGNWTIPTTGLNPLHYIWGTGSPDMSPNNSLDCTLLELKEDTFSWIDIACENDPGSPFENGSFVCQKNSCPPSAFSFQTNCYIPMTKRTSWFYAEQDCIAVGGHLASVHSQAENDFILSIQYSDSWLGGKMTATGATSFNWTDGSPVDFTNWKRGQPNDGSGNFVVLSNYDGFWWDDFHAVFSVCKL